MQGAMRASSAPPALVTSPREWRGADLQEHPEAWLYRLSAREIAALRIAAQDIVARGVALQDVDASSVDLSSLAPALADWRRRLKDGIGVVLVRGLPVRDMSKQEAAAAYWLLGLGLGAPASQNTAGETLVDVRDTGASAADHDTRLYKTRADLTFHTDGADIIGLLCLRAARSGGLSRICSSVYVYNEVVRRRPDLAPLLEAPFHHHAHGQFGPRGPKTFQYPIVNREGGVFRMFLLLWYIRNAAADFPDIASLDSAQSDVLDLLAAIPMEPGAALDMRFQEGDMQFLKNSVILHARTEYEDWGAEDEKRHLLRLWLSAADFADGDDRLRGGVATRSHT
jgi:hypothetical protein